MTHAEVEAVVGHFEGLVKKTAAQIVAQEGMELEFDDVAQLLRYKVWRGVLTFDKQRAAQSKRLSQPRRGRSALERFVFTCVMNMRKDIEKRPRRFNSSIEALREDFQEARSMVLQETYAGSMRAEQFDNKYLRTDAEPLPDEYELPPTLTAIERRLIELKLDGRLLREIDRELGLSRAQREKLLESVRAKLAHLDPAAKRSAPMRPLPHAAPRQRHTLGALAA